MSGVAAAVGLGTAAAGVYAAREQRKGAEAAADAARFRPTDITTPFGSVDASMGDVSATLSPELQRQYEGLLSFGQQRLQQAQDPTASLGFLSRAFGPELERQRLAQESRLFNQGLLGSTTGQRSIEGLRTAQNQALLGAALTERDTATSQGLGLLSGALDISNLPSNLIATSGNIGSQQAAAGANVGQGLAAAANSRANSISSIFSGLGQAAGAFIGRQPQQTLPTSIFSGSIGNAPGSVPSAGQFALGANIPRYPY
jgi:hypothetical protein